MLPAAGHRIMRLLGTLHSHVNFFERRSIFELGISAALYYFLLFFLTPILIELGWITDNQFFDAFFSYEISDTALWYGLVGLGGIITGYFLVFPRNLFLRIKNPFQKEWNPTRIPGVFWTTFVFGLGAKILRILGGAYFHGWRKDGFLVNSPFYSGVGYLEWLSSAALLIAFLRYFSLLKANDPRAGKWKWIAWGVFAIEIIYAIPSCGRILILIPCILYLIARTYVLGMRNWQIILLAGFLVSIVMPLGTLCLSVNSESTVSRLLYENSRISWRNIPIVVQASVLIRTNQNIVLSKIVDEERLEFTSLRCRDMAKNLLVLLGPPRFLWKDKPVIGNDGNDFGRRFGLVLPDDFETGIGATVVGSWYFHCGFWGIAFGMLALGFLWRAIYAYLIENTGQSLSGIMIYSILWINIIKGMENEVVPVYAGLIKIFIILAIVHFFLSRGDRVVR